MKPDSVHTFKCGGTLKRFGPVLKAHWTHDVLGRPLKNGHETWAHDTEESAKDSFADMVEMWDL